MSAPRERRRSAPSGPGCGHSGLQAHRARREAPRPEVRAGTERLRRGWKEAGSTTPRRVARCGGGLARGGSAGTSTTLARPVGNAAIRVPQYCWVPVVPNKGCLRKNGRHTQNAVVHMCALWQGADKGRGRAWRPAHAKPRAGVLVGTFSIAVGCGEESRPSSEGWRGGKNTRLSPLSFWIPGVS